MRVPSKIQKCILASFLMLMLQNPEAKATQMNDNETQFAIGYAAFLRGDYYTCADQFYASLAEGEPLSSRARLYLAVCQSRIKLKSLSAANFDQIDMDVLTPYERNLAKQLEPSIRNEREALHAAVWILNPYFGQGTYSANDPSLTASTFFGLETEVYKDSLQFKASYESLSVQAHTATSDYSQSQWLLGFGQNLFPFEYRVRALGVTTDNVNYNNIMSVGGGVSYWVFDKKNRMSFDLFSTHMPNSTLGDTTVQQTTLSSSQYIFTDTNSSLWGQIGWTGIAINSPLGAVPKSAFIVNKNVSHFFGDLVYALDKMQYSLGMTNGSEIFGVRNDGAILYSSPEEHKSGWTGSVRYQYSKSSSFEFGYGQENIVKGTSTSLVNTSVSSYHFLGTFAF